MENNWQNKGKVTEAFEVLDSRWVMINVQIAKLQYGLDTNITFGGNGSKPSLELTGDGNKIAEFVLYLNLDATGNPIESVKKYPI